IVAGATLAVLVLSPARALSAPGAGGGLRGVFQHKNLLGAGMALAFVAEWHFHEARPRAKTLRLLSLCVFGALLVLSDSMSSMITVCAALMGVWTVRVLCGRFRVPVAAVAIFAGLTVAAVTVAGVGSADVLGLLGRSSDMTGRTELWSAVTDAIKEKP